MAWRPPKKPRPICLHCRTNPTKETRTRYCSYACAGAAKRIPRPLCAFCKKRPVRLVWRGDKYCSRSCAALARGPKQIDILRKGWLKAMETQRVKYFARVNAWLKLEIEPIVALMPPEQQQAGRLALMKLALRVNRVAYERGYKCARNRIARGAAA